MHHLNNAAATVSAMNGAGGTGINLPGIQGLLLAIATLVVIFAGLVIALNGRKGNFRKSADSGGAVMIGVLVIGVGLALPVAAAFGTDIINWLSS